MSELNFDTAATSVAASEAATEKVIPPQNFIGAPEDNAEAEAKAREYKWPEKKAYDYSVYTPGAEGDRPDAELPKWASSAAKYQWADEYGEVGPRVPELEKILFNDEFIVKAEMEGMKVYKNAVVKEEGPQQMKPVLRFLDAGLHPVLMETLNLMNYEHPTPIQAYVIPAVLTGSDVVATAQTGSGKTGAYMIPIISRLMGKAKKLCAPRPNPITYNPASDRVRAEPLVLIVAPTRELVCQIFDEARRLCYRTMFRPCVAYGGGPMGLQRQELEMGCDILIATPGRLIDFMNKPSLLSLNRVKYTVIDEADELMKSDWEENMHAIMSGGDSNEDPDHVYMMCSATFPKDMRKVARQYMDRDYYRVRIGRIGATHSNIQQIIIWADEPKKQAALYDLLFSLTPARTVIFVNGKRAADHLDDFLFNKGLPSTSIHGDRTQREREDAILSFKQGVTPILVATAVAARGIDINNVKHVINYDLPSGEHGGIQEYVHRIGRTARIGHIGRATAFYNERDSDLAEALVKLLIENDQEIPDFLEEYKPMDDTLDFDDESDPDTEPDADDARGDATGWGDAPAANGDGDDGFKADGADNSFQADAGADAW